MKTKIGVVVQKYFKKVDVKNLSDNDIEILADVHYYGSRDILINGTRAENFDDPALVSLWGELEDLYLPFNEKSSDFDDFVDSLDVAF